MIGYLKAAQLISVSLLLGGPAFLRMIWAPSLPKGGALSSDRLLRQRVQWISLVAAVALCALALTDLLRLGSQLSGQGLLHGDTISFAAQLASGTTMGQVTVLRAILALGVLAFVPWRPMDRVSAPLLLLTSLGLMATFSLTGHAAGAGVGPVAADLVHMAATVAWYGGLCCFAMLPWRDLLREEHVVRSLFRRFSTLGLAAVGLLTLTGIYMASLRLYGPEALVEHAYGQNLLIKLGFLGGVLLLAAFNLFWVGPRLKRGDGAAPRVGTILRWFVTGEAAVGLAVVYMAGILATTAPPQGAPVRLTVTLTQEAQELVLQAPRNQPIRLTVMNPGDTPITFVIKALPHEMLDGGHQHGGGAVDMPLYVPAKSKRLAQFVVRRPGRFEMDMYTFDHPGPIGLGVFEAQ